MRTSPTRAGAPRRARAVTGIVTTQPSAMSRTTAQWTWRQRRRPPPTPTTDEATTCVVETGAPSARGGDDHAGRRTLARDAVERVMRIDAAPDRLHDAPAAERGAERQRGRAGDDRPRRASRARRAARRRRAAPRCTPTDFCASLAPWLNASAADIAHSPPRIGPRQRRVARRSPRRRPRIASSAGERAEQRRDGERDACRSRRRAQAVESAPAGSASAPPATSAAPTRPPTSAWPELDGSPSAQVASVPAPPPPAAPARDHVDRGAARRP